MTDFYLGFDNKGQGGLGTTNSGGGAISKFDAPADVGTNTATGSTTTAADYSNGMTYNSDTDQWILAVRGQAFYVYNSLADVQTNNVAQAVVMNAVLNYNNGFSYNADTGTYFAAYSSAGSGAIVEFASLQDMANFSNIQSTVSMNGISWDNGIEYDSATNLWYGAFSGGLTAPGGVWGFSSLADLATASNPVSQTAYSNNVVDYEMGLAIVPCFTTGTLIMTQNGSVEIEKLAVGDLILTRDNGLQPIRWIGSRKLSSMELAVAPNLRPILIRAGALGPSTPVRDLVVSPQHRILIRSKIAQRMFGTDEVLVAAKHLRELPGIEVVDDLAEVEYFHILFDRHEILLSNGSETESFYAGSEALNALGTEASDEIFALFPELRNGNPNEIFPPARPLVKGRTGRQMAFRHTQNKMALFG